MKRILVLFGMILMISLAACSGSEETLKKDNETNASSHQTEHQEKKVSPSKNKENDDQNKQDNDEEMDEEKQKFAEKKYKVDTNSWSIVPLEDQIEEKVALLTIDDAPDNHAVEMAKTLKELDVNAIFFVNGHFLETDEDKGKLKEIYDMGFLIGNHTYSHAFLPDLSEQEQKEEIVKVSDMVEEITGERPKFFRAPNGANTDYSKQVADKEGMILMNWTYGFDWEPEYQTKEAITDIMVNTEYLNDGANLLMHDRKWTAAGLHDIVRGLEEKGYEIVDPNSIQTKE
ncbi:peptidoglycan/xylan/chitin deacetylase (PgdA/CDA1 family) [Virgibacillus campisalis]|uniref:Peptidoglycan/xylan/chitin deacetylase (PgdA/CDA1 family) n=1 Tax=Virgibacillus alimentarius TaxID=698769 RepID=A0ABS4S5Y2_9BACI|nr:peptidoglycan/xylan/chitin deacetylase (PgdA/CDA1 family) [Virgibacillus alimentarius]